VNVKTFACAVLALSAAVFSTAALAAAPREYTRMAEEPPTMNAAQLCDMNVAKCGDALKVCIRNAGGSLLLQRRCDAERDECESNACNPPTPPATTGDTTAPGTAPATGTTPNSGM
jgi:hypothetical protein